VSLAAAALRPVFCTNNPLTPDTPAGRSCSPAVASSATSSPRSPPRATSPRPTTYLDYYGHVYAEPDFLGNDQTVRGSWRADAFIAQLARQVFDLGGNPTLVQPRTDYMGAGIHIALDDPAD
jgi:hypothetical protein